MVTPTARRGAVQWIRETFEVSQRRACRLVNAARAMVRYGRRRAAADEALLRDLERLAAERPRFGYRRLHTLLVRAGQQVNRKRVHRLYREAGLAVHRKRRKRVAQANRQPRVVAAKPNEEWSADFMGDTLASGRSFRCFNVVDDASRECLASEVDLSLPATRVIRVLDRLAAQRGKPKRIVFDNGPEFTSKALDQWAYESGVELVFIRPGKPVENCFVESFNGKMRDECLNAHWFTRCGRGAGAGERCHPLPRRATSRGATSREGGGQFWL
jgi:putative transposase